MNHRLLSIVVASVLFGSGAVYAQDAEKKDAEAPKTEQTAAATESQSKLYEQLRSERDALQAKYDEFQQKMATLDATKADLQQRNLALEQQIEEMKKQVADAQTTATTAVEALANFKKELEQKKDATYVVKRNDSLSKIATATYGDKDKWREIYQANRDKMRHPNDLRVGMTITLPPKK